MTPREPESLFHAARRSARAAGVAGVTLSMLATFELHALAVGRAARDPLFDRYRAVWFRSLVALLGVELVVIPSRPAPPPPGTARLIVSNHRSAVDILVMLHLFGGSLVSRGDLAGWPFIGTLARMGGTIFVDREQGMSRAGAARAIRRRLAEGATISLFPEGTTFEGDTVRPFHAGAFASARGQKVEVVPVGLAYAPGVEFGDETFVAHLGRTAGRVGTRVVACIGEPSSVGDDTRAASTRYHDEVQALVDRARAAF